MNFFFFDNKPKTSNAQAEVSKQSMDDSNVFEQCQMEDCDTRADLRKFNADPAHYTQASMRNFHAGT